MYYVDIVNKVIIVISNPVLNIIETIGLKNISISIS